MKNKRKQNAKITKATIAISQILILVIATIAFSWMIGGEIKTVSADASGLTSDSECIALGGTCMLSTSCTGEIRIGFCPGDATIRCCVPTTTAEEPEPEKDKINIPNIIATSEGALKIPKQVKRITKNLFSSKTSEPLIDAALDKEIAAAMKANDAYIESLGIEHIPTNFEKFFGLGGSEGGFFSSVGGQIIVNAAAAVATALIINYFAKKYASQRNAGDISTLTWISVVPAAIGGYLLGTGSALIGGLISGGIVLFAVAVYMVVGYQLYSQEKFTYRSGLWQPPTGGAECSKCNSLTIAGENECSEYICHSYGAACDWVNDETEYETCIEVNPGDISPSVIEPAKNIYGEDVFQNSQYDYRTSSTGARIVYSGEGGESGLCVPAFTPIKIALTTNENSHCKISLEPTTGTSADAFSTMQDMAEGTAYTKNHTLQLPSSVSANTDSLIGSGYSLNNDGTFKFYVRCEDVRGNINTVDYMIQFCVQMGPDLEPPEITGSNPVQNSYIAYNTSIIKDFQIYTNEPADCKWDTKEVNYPYMSNNFTKCSQRVDDYLVGFEYGCQVNLTGFKNGIENKYYVACIDHPELKGTVKEDQRNIMRPYEVILKGTSKLLIQNVMINGKSNGTAIRGSEENADVRIEILTSGGAEEGNARCLYTEDSTDSNSYSLFSNDGSREYLTTNTEEFYMSQGIYKYFIRCFDIADNFADTMINFSVEVDNLTPTIIRAYKDEESNSLKIITDEVGECVFSTTSCNYEIESGTEINTINGKEHYVDWDSSRDLYIKCIDEFNNRPAEGECSIIIRPFEVVQTIQ